jgi:hypothetical protein
VFLVVAFVLELSRVTLGVFARDAVKWRLRDKTGIVEDDVSSAESEKIVDLRVQELGR